MRRRLTAGLLCDTIESKGIVGLVGRGDLGGAVADRFGMLFDDQSIAADVRLVLVDRADHAEHRRLRPATVIRDASMAAVLATILGGGGGGARFELDGARTVLRLAPNPLPRPRHSRRKVLRRRRQARHAPTQHRPQRQYQSQRRPLELLDRE